MSKYLGEAGLALVVQDLTSKLGGAGGFIPRSPLEAHLGFEVTGAGTIGSLTGFFSGGSAPQISSDIISFSNGVRVHYYVASERVLACIWGTTAGSTYGPVTGADWLDSFELWSSFRGVQRGSIGGKGLTTARPSDLQKVLNANGINIGFKNVSGTEWIADSFSNNIIEPYTPPVPVDTTASALQGMVKDFLGTAVITEVNESTFISYLSSPPSSGVYHLKDYDAGTYLISAAIRINRVAPITNVEVLATQRQKGTSQAGGGFVRTAGAHNSNDGTWQHRRVVDACVNFGWYGAGGGGSYNAALPVTVEGNRISGITSISGTTYYLINRYSLFDGQNTVSASTMWQAGGKPAASGVAFTPTIELSQSNVQSALDWVGYKLYQKAELSASGATNWDSNNLKIEYGIWTPEIYGDSTAGSPTYSLRQGFYYRIGRLVCVFGSIALSAVGGMNGALKIKGLPFTDSVLTTQWRTSGTVGYIQGWNVTVATNRDYFRPQIYLFNGNEIAIQVAGTDSSFIHLHSTAIVDNFTIRGFNFTYLTT